MVPESASEVREGPILREKGKSTAQPKSKVRGESGKTRSRFLARVARGYKLCL